MTAAAPSEHCWPRPAELLPHGAAAVLLDEIVSCTSEEIVCAGEVAAERLNLRGASVPFWAGLEYMAQTAAVFAGVAQHKGGGAMKRGFVVACRRLSCPAPGFAAGGRLLTRARLLREGGPLRVFECSIFTQCGAAGKLTLLQEGELSVYLAE